MASIGAILSLDAVGKQDKYLDSPNPRDSLWHYTPPERPSKFSSYQQVVKVNRPATTSVSSSWPFEQDITVLINPQEHGDLLTGISLCIHIPELLDGASKNRFYCDNLAWAMIDTINIRIDDVDVMTLYGDSLMIDYELMSNASRKRALNSLNGGGGFKEHTVFIKLPGFCTPSNPLPLCAIHKQKIRFNVKFNPVKAFSDTGEVIDINEFDLVLNVTDVTPQEKIALMYSEFTRTYTSLERKPKQEIDEKEIRAPTKYNLVGSETVRSIIWFFRRDAYEEFSQSTQFQNRHNLSISPTPDLASQEDAPIMSSADIYINGEVTLSPFKDVTKTLKTARNYHKYNDIYYTPKRDIFSYNFSMNPMDDAPSGALDTSKTNSNASFLQLTLNKDVVNRVIHLHVYFVIERKFSFSNGYLK